MEHCPENKDKLVSDQQIRNMESGKFVSENAYEMNYRQGAMDIRDLYEAELRKHRELIPYVKHEKNCYLKRPDAILDGIGCTCGLQEKLDALTK